MTSALQTYRHDLGEKLSRLLGADWRFYKSRMVFVKKDSLGQQEISIDSVAKYSPWVDFSLYFRREFTLAPDILQAVGLDGVGFQQNSHNRASIKGLPFAGSGRGVWSVNVSQSMPEDLPENLMEFIANTIQPFFALFPAPEAWRDDLAQGRCSDGWARKKSDYWRDLLALDLHLRDTPHFKEWLAKNKLPPSVSEEASKIIGDFEKIWNI